MRAVGGALSVMAEQIISGDIEEALYAFGLQLRKALAKRLMVIRVELVALGQDP